MTRAQQRAVTQKRPKLRRRLLTASAPACAIWESSFESTPDTPNGRKLCAVEALQHRHVTATVDK
jgi:hypothetical protein